MPREFSLKDDCTLSGKRLHRDERSAQPVRGTGEHCSRVEGGGYVDLAGRSRPKGSKGAKCLWNVGGGGSRQPLLAAHGAVLQPAPGMKPGETLHRRDTDVTEAEREAVAEWVWRTAKNT